MALLDVIKRLWVWFPLLCGPDPSAPKGGTVLAAPCPRKNGPRSQGTASLHGPMDINKNGPNPWNCLQAFSRKAVRPCTTPLLYAAECGRDQ